MSELTSALGTIASSATGGILAPILNIIDKIIPDPAAKAQAQLALVQLQQQGQLQQEANNLQLALAQAQTNTEDAKSPDWFRAGWRPFVGWICGFGVSYAFLAQPLLSWFASIHKWPVPPSLDMGTLLPLLLGMLGLGTLRTTEKLKGV